MHTYPVSSCSKLSPVEQVRLFKEAGYDTIIVSDHFSPHHFKKLGEHLTFAEKVDKLCDAYLEAKAEGDRIGLTVLFSVELSFHKNHYLLYGVTREFLKLREDIFDIDIDELYAHLKAHGVTIIQAHSHRAEKCVPHPHHVDGFEINCCLRKDNYNERTMQVAKEYGLPLTIGSDCHRPEDVGVSATLSEEKIESIEQYLELMRAGKLILSIGGGTL
ncbi:MAG: PHP domain-containing protein [Clostridia bacterium]|nr:PHP domain-containing protein [Clostridia bacterium]